MTVRRLFVPVLPAEGGVVALPAESAKHVRVLRLAPGAALRLFDGRANEADARLVEVTRDAVRCEASSPQRVEVALPRVHALVGLAKGTKLDDAVRMLTELGVYAVHPVVCVRSVARPRGSHARHERLERIALEACAQSGQPRAPDVHAAVGLEEAATLAPRDAVKVVFWEEATEGLEAVLAGQRTSAPELWIVIGPEGGLAADEVEMLGRFGFGAAGLGRAKLRVETAVPVCVALVMARLGSLTPSHSE